MKSRQLSIQGFENASGTVAYRVFGYRIRRQRAAATTLSVTQVREPLTFLEGRQGEKWVPCYVPVAATAADAAAQAVAA